MIDNYDTLIRYVNKKHNPSGAKLAMNYAKRKGLRIINLYKVTNKLASDMNDK